MKILFIFLFFKILFISNISLAQEDNENKINKFLGAAKTLNDNFSALGPRFINADKKSHKQSNVNLKIAEMKFISGSCMFFKKKTFDSLGGFDENFFYTLKKVISV